MWDRLRPASRSALSFAGLLVGWWLLTAAEVVPRAYLPSPASVWDAFVRSLAGGTLVRHIAVSVARLVGAHIVASLLGIAAGVMMGLIPGVGRFFRPLLSFFNSLSGITWLPLAIAWFGIGWRTDAFVIMNSIFFIVAVNTLSGVQSVPRVYEQALLTLGAGRLRVIFHVLVPGAMPGIITGLRLAIGFGWRALIAVEMLAGAVGMGYLVFNASYNFQQDVVLMGILVVGVMASALDQLVFAPLERWTIERWGLI